LPICTNGSIQTQWLRRDRVDTEAREVIHRIGLEISLIEMTQRARRAQQRLRFFKNALSHF
jgi:hypothetical protein